MISAAIYGIGGQALTDAEVGFFTEVDPWGYILFRRNCETRDQVQALCASLKNLAGRNVPILIDHEGGRVSRLSPHLVDKRPPADIYAQIVLRDGLEAGIAAALIGGEILARDAYALGLNVNCVPMVDVRNPRADNIIGDRALGETAGQVTALGRALAHGTLAGGCLPVVKHIPGHGRSLCDSHLDLPRVDANGRELCDVDFAPFRALNELPLGMTAHIVYDAFDARHPATLSKTVIDNVIRGHIGFDGLLMTDDLSMKALGGGFSDRAAAALRAGCDLVLHCNGDMAEMIDVATGTGAMTADAQRRSYAALAQWRTPDAIDEQDLNARFASLTNAVNF